MDQKTCGKQDTCTTQSNTIGSETQTISPSPSNLKSGKKDCKDSKASPDAHGDALAELFSSIKDWYLPDEKTPTSNFDFHSKFKGKIVVGMFFQQWCKGCHTYTRLGVKPLFDAYKNNPKVNFVAIQTVFEGGYKMHTMSYTLT
mmetsp:Transcript_8260/g.12899  ORF Transcript_8260/g.12899 Transcript_8260/m.12899 type:complete len:144 (-) Transcript_8260:20-451(-)